MIDHIGLTVHDVEKSKAFYLQALAPLGFELVTEADGWVGIGPNGNPEFWFGPHDLAQRPMHICFRAENRAQVDAFYQAALAAGGQDHGTPGIRQHYHENYYGAFVLDPDGHNLEAVCHDPE